MKRTDEKYCQECGSLINIKAEICPKCGVRQAVSISVTSDGVNQEWLILLLLCWFLGILGIHRFYTGHTTIGVVQLLTLGGCGIWVLIDFIMIILGKFEHADGRVILMK
jgi:TM2 domain-containing membrane protein YozV